MKHRSILNSLKDVSKKLKKHLLFSMVVICVLTTSCTYYPRLTSIPLIKEKGDTRIEGGVSVYSPSIQASFSHGATDNIAIQVAASVGLDNDFYTHGAIGLYKNKQERNVMELYGGVAYGHGFAVSGSTGGSLGGNFQLYFAQFNYGNIEKKSANKEWGFGLKTGYLSSKMTDEEYFSIDYPQNEPFPDYTFNGFVAEPTVFLRFGREKLKFNMALGYSLYYQFNHKENWQPANAPNFGIGMSYSFGGINNK